MRAHLIPPTPSGWETGVKHSTDGYSKHLQAKFNCHSWATDGPRQSGLTEACMNSPHLHDTVRREILDYIKKWIPRQWAGVLAGSSVHADRVFLVQEMPEVVDWLHYRCSFHNPSVSNWRIYRSRCGRIVGKLCNTSPLSPPYLIAQDVSSIKVRRGYTLINEVANTPWIGALPKVVSFASSAKKEW